MITGHQQQLFDWLAKSEHCMLALRTLDVVADKYGLQDCWIAAGFVRNLVWDKLHGINSTRLNDVDVIYFSTEINECYEHEIENALKERAPSIPWSVKNQARMHLKNNDQPYLSSIDAMSYWPELETAVAVRLQNGQLKLAAPFGLVSLFSLQLTLNPKRSDTIFNQRIKDKSWLQRYSKLKVINTTSR